MLKSEVGGVEMVNEQLWNEYGPVLNLVPVIVVGVWVWWHETHWCSKCERTSLRTTKKPLIWVATASAGWVPHVVDVRVTSCCTPLCTFRPVEKHGKPRLPTERELDNFEWEF